MRLPPGLRPDAQFFFLRLFRAVPGSGRFQLTNLLGYGLGLGFGLGLELELG